MSVPQNLQTPPTSSLSPRRCVKPNSSNTFKKLIPFFICHTYIYIYIHTHIFSLLINSLSVYQNSLNPHCLFVPKYSIFTSKSKTQRNPTHEGLKQILHAGTSNSMVLLQHRRAITEQVLAQQLRVQVPNLPHSLPHACLLSLQLHCHQLVQACSIADLALSPPVPQDFGSQPYLLLVGGRRQRVLTLSSSVVYSGCWGHHAVFHCGFCLFHDFEEGELAYLSHSCSCCHWCYHCHWGK